MFTKGPWHANTSKEQSLVYQEEEAGESIAVCYNASGKHKANAILIAAAPELLKTLKEAISLIEDVARESATERFYQQKANDFQQIVGQAEDWR